jgi:dephospho-CoA kinase
LSIGKEEKTEFSGKKGKEVKIIIIVGMPASGKNIARSYAEARGIPYFATGDLVRKEVQKRGLEPTPENTARTSTDLRGEDGLGVTRLALEKAVGSGCRLAFMEGMRSWPEIEWIREKAEAFLVAFIAPKKVRSDRIAARGRSDDSAVMFDARDTREIAYGSAVPIALADEYILNIQTVEESTAALDRIMKKFAPSSI